MRIKIFLVIGSSGVYEDHTQWIVAARRTRRAARAFLNRVRREVDREFTKIAAAPFADKFNFAKRLTLDQECCLAVHQVRDPAYAAPPDVEFGQLPPHVPKIYIHGVDYRIEETTLE